MKKLIAGIVVTALVFSVGVVSVFATDQTARHNFVDSNMDGVCDNAGSRENGKNYVDEDDDGVCDRQGNNAMRPQNGQGMQKGRNKS